MTENVKIPVMGATKDESDPMAVLRYVNPAVGDWFVIEAEKTRDGDVRLYGFARIFECEFGTEYLSNLKDAGFILDDEFTPMEISEVRKIHKPGF